jgi:hypothetical protein
MKNQSHPKISLKLLKSQLGSPRAPLHMTHMLFILLSLYFLWVLLETITASPSSNAAPVAGYMPFLGPYLWIVTYAGFTRLVDKMYNRLVLLNEPNS